MTAAGLTSVHDAGAGRSRLVAYQDAREAGELRHRVYAMVRGPYERLRNAGSTPASATSGCASAE